MITDEIQCKDNSGGTPNKSFILRSQSLHISFTVGLNVWQIQNMCVLFVLKFIAFNIDANNVDLINPSNWKVKQRSPFYNTFIKHLSIRFLCNREESILIYFKHIIFQTTPNLLLLIHAGQRL